MSERITAALRRAVIERAQGCCEYCGMPDTETLLPHEPDHVIATQHGGQTALENLEHPPRPALLMAACGVTIGDENRPTQWLCRNHRSHASRSGGGQVLVDLA